MKKLAAFLILLAGSAFADTGFKDTIRLSETDNSPACTVGWIQVSTGTLTCSGGKATLMTGGGGGGGGGSGDITDVIAGRGLSGGSTTGAATLNVVSTAAYQTQANTFTSSQTITAAGGLGVSYEVKVGSLTVTGSGTGVLQLQEGSVPSGVAGKSVLFGNSSTNWPGFIPNNQSTYAIVGASVTGNAGSCAQFSADGSLIAGPLGACGGSTQGGNYAVQYSSAGVPSGNSGFTVQRSSVVVDSPFSLVSTTMTVKSSATFNYEGGSGVLINVTTFSVVGAYAAIQGTATLPSAFTVKSTVDSSDYDLRVDSAGVVSAKNLTITGDGGGMLYLTEGSTATGAAGSAVFYATSTSHWPRFIPNAGLDYFVMGSSVTGSAGSCAQFSANGSLIPSPSGACGSGVGGSGDITDVIAGTGLSGGSGSGAATLNVVSTAAYQTQSNTFTSSQTVAHAGGLRLTGPILASSGTLGSAGNAVFISSNLVAGATIYQDGRIAALNLSGSNTGDQTITLTGDVTGSGTGSFATTAAALQPNITTLNAAAGITVVASTFNVNNVKMLWPSSGTIGNYLRYISSNTLSWDATAGGGSGETNTYTSSKTFTGGLVISSGVFTTLPQIITTTTTLTSSMTVVLASCTARNTVNKFITLTLPNASNAAGFETTIHDVGTDSCTVKIKGAGTDSVLNTTGTIELTAKTDTVTLRSLGAAGWGAVGNFVPTPASIVTSPDEVGIYTPSASSAVYVCPIFVPKPVTVIGFRANRISSTGNISFGLWDKDGFFAVGSTTNTTVSGPTNYLLNNPSVNSYQLTPGWYKLGVSLSQAALTLTGSNSMNDVTMMCSVQATPGNLDLSKVALTPGGARNLNTPSIHLLIAGGLLAN